MSNTTTITRDAPGESAWQKTVRKAQEEPGVPLGLVLTTAALIGATSSMRKGNRAQFNKFLRFRVGAQAFTVVAALGGSLYYGEQRRREKKEETKANAKARTDAEFQQSLRLAEQAQAREDAMPEQRRIVKKRKSGAPPSAVLDALEAEDKKV